MNAPYSFNFKYDPILENPFRSEIDYNKEIDERVRQLQLMKDKYNSTVKQTIQSESLWNKIDNEIKSLNDDQRNILFSDKNYISIDTQLKILVQEALVNSVKNVIENTTINMKNFEHIIDHYKDHIRLDNETAWNIICRFKDIVENKNDKDNEMFWCIMKDIHEELRGKHFDEVYATYQVDNMYHTDNKGNKITSPMFTPIDVRKLYDKKFKSINSNITFWDVYVALNAQYHDNIELYKEWFGEDNIENIKDKIIESAIVNWFEDEDAGIEKVWNYFRAI